MPGPVIPSPFMMPQGRQPKQDKDYLQQLLMSLVGTAASSAIQGGVGKLFEKPIEEQVRDTALLATANDTSGYQARMGAFQQLMTEFPEQAQSNPYIAAYTASLADTSIPQPEKMMLERQALAVSPTLYEDSKRQARVQQRNTVFSGLLQQVDGEIAQLNSAGLSPDAPEVVLASQRKQALQLEIQFAQLEESGQITPEIQANIRAQQVNAIKDLASVVTLRRTRLLADPNADVDSFRQGAQGGAGSMDFAAIMGDMGLGALVEYDATRGQRYSDQMSMAASQWMAANPIAASLGATVQDVSSWLQGGVARPQLREFFAMHAAEQDLAHKTMQAQAFAAALDISQPLQLSLGMIQGYMAEGNVEKAAEEYNRNFRSQMLRTPGLDPEMIRNYAPVLSVTEATGRSVAVGVFAQLGAAAAGAAAGAGAGALAGAGIGALGGPVSAVGGGILGGIAGLWGGFAAGGPIKEAIQVNRTVAPGATSGVDHALNTLAEVGGDASAALRTLQEDITLFQGSQLPEDLFMFNTITEAMNILRGRLGMTGTPSRNPGIGIGAISPLRP